MLWEDSISRAKIHKDKVLFPVDSNGCVDFNFMETYINAIKKLCIARLKASDVFANSRIASTQSRMGDEIVENYIPVLDTPDIPTPSA